ncbi:MAG: polysaccharide biosynthesis tyrosine autokinase [Bacteroidia bacterium]
MYQDDINSTKENFDLYRERLTNFGSEFEIGLFLFIARKCVPWILAFFILGIGSSYIYVRYSPWVYESSTILQIRADNTANKVLDMQNLSDKTNDDLPEAIELMRSKVFLKEVLFQLPLQTSYFTEGTFKNNELYTSSPFEVKADIKSSEIIGRKINIHFYNSEKGTLQFQLNKQVYNYSFQVNQLLHLPDVDLKITLNNYKNITQEQNGLKQDAFYFILNDSDNLVNQYYNRLTVKILNDDAKSVLISFRDNNPTKAADIVRTVAAEFMQFDVEKKSQSAKSVLTFIDEQLDNVYEKLKNSEDSIESFKKENNIDPNPELATANVARLNSLEDRITTVELEENLLKQIEVNIKAQKNIDASDLLTMLAGSDYAISITDQMKELHDLLVQKEKMLYNVTPDNEEIKSVNYEIEAQQKILLAAISSIYKQEEDKKQNLIGKAAEFENKNFQVPANDVEYSRLERLYAINEKYYTLLLERKTEYSISKAGYVSQNVILEKPEISRKPISPDKNIAITVGLLLALLSSLLLILLRYVFYNEINSLHEITKHTSASVSILGIVPKYQNEIPVSQLLIDKSPKSIVAEAFRSIRTNLQFISNDPASKIIAVTSTISGEGKTFVAINLAGIIAFSGKKVIILDLDMRKPKIHLGFNAENTKGMSTALIGKDSLEDCIQKSNLQNLDFITAGPIPPNPSELIISPKMDVILAELKTKYDMIIIDNPPVGLVTDGIAMIQKADYPIYILRAEYSKRSFIQNVDRLFNENNIKKISIILNGVDVKRKSYGYNYGYGYGYGYGSGYGYYDEEHKKKKSFFSKK